LSDIRNFLEWNETMPFLWKPSDVCSAKRANRTGSPGCPKAIVAPASTDNRSGLDRQ
jgi:hypothetical protein